MRPAGASACSTSTGRPARPVAQGAAPLTGKRARPASTSHTVSTTPRFASCCSFDCVVLPVVGGAHQDATERPVGPADVGVRQGAEADVDRDEDGRQRVRAGEEEHRHGGEHEAGGVHERVGAERGEDAQLFLGVVQRVHAPQHADAVVTPVGEPVAQVHGQQRDDDHGPTRPLCRPGGLEPGGVAAQDDGAAHAEQRHERRDGQDVQEEVRRVLHVAAGEERTAFGRPQALARHRGEHEDDEARSDELGPPGVQGGAEAVRPEKGVDRLEEDEARGGGEPERPGDSSAAPRGALCGRQLRRLIVVTWCPSVRSAPARPR